jgi:hypothetical protein
MIEQTTRGMAEMVTYRMNVCNRSSKDLPIPSSLSSRYIFKALSKWLYTGGNMKIELEKLKMENAAIISNMSLAWR